MSKPSAATSVQRNPSISQLPARSAWLRGPPTVNASTPPTIATPSSRSQSPAPALNTTSQNAPSSSSHTGHSRRPSALSGSPIAVGMGVSTSVPRAIPGKNASPVTFGSIDQPAAPLSSSPAAIPVLSSDAATKLKSFGSIPHSTPLPSAVNGKPVPVSNATPPSTEPSPPVPSGSLATSTATSTAPSSVNPVGISSVARKKLDVKKLFQGGGQPSPTANTFQPDPPPQRAPTPAPIPSGPMHQGIPPQPRPYPPYSPSASTRQLAQPPRSPSFPRQLANGRPGGPPQQSNGSTSGPHSPRMGMQAPPQGPGPGSNGPPPNGAAPSPMPGPPQPGQPPMQMHPQMQWGGYYFPQYAGMPDQSYMGQPPYGAPWLPPHAQHHIPPPHQAHLQPHAPHSPHQPPHPVSPRVPPPPLTSPPPQSPNITSPPTPNTQRLSNAAPAFVPRPRAAVVIKDSTTGKEIDLRNHNHKRESSVTSVALTPEKKKTPIVRMETEDAKKQRLEAAQRKEREKEEKERLEKEELERIKRERDEAERRKREEEEKAKQEAAEKERLRIQKEEDERLRKEEEERERIRKEEQEKTERLRKEEEERERLRMEEEKKERLRKEEEERERLRIEKERKELLRKEEEEKERLRAEELEHERVREDEEEAERLRLEDERRDIAHTPAIDTARLSESPAMSPIRPSTPIASPIKLGEHKKRPIPGPLDLSSASRAGLPPSLPSALATARIINNLDEISYPQGIKSPKVELNQGAKDGKFRYDRDFLLQFMQVCKEKPDNLPPLDAIGIDPSDNASMSHPMGRTRSERNRSVSTNVPAPGSIPNRQPAVGLGLGMNFNSKNQAGGFRMGEFSMSPGNSGMRHVTGPAGMANVPFPPGKPPLVRTASQGGVNGIQPSGLGTNRNRGSRTGRNRTDASRVNSAHGMPPPFGGQPPLAFEPIAPLETSANRWVPGSVVRRPQAIDENAPEVVDRKVKGLLNKLTMERFDSISDQIIEWANKSEKEQDGRTLMRVIRLVFEKATDEATWSEMYARLCRKMLEKISGDVVDEGIKTSEGKPFSGGQLFRKYLLNRCQEDFERGWQMKEATSAAAAAKADDDNKVAVQGGEEALYSEEYYAAQKAKRQGLGLVKFIGELFKLQMLTERIMHECIKKLLGNVDNPAEEEIESLCKLLTTVGQQLDTAKAQKHLDVYFGRMQELASSSKIGSRMQYMLVDVIELRGRRWQTRNLVSAPTTIAAVHEQAAKEKAAAEKEAYGRAMPMSRGGSRRGEHSRGDFSQSIGPDGWAVAGGANTMGPPRPTGKAGDLSLFGKINKANMQLQFGPSGVFAAKKDTKGREPGTLSRTASSSNMFSMLGNPDTSAEPLPSRGSQPPSRKPSADFTQTGIPEGPARKRLQLKPRSTPKANDSKEVIIDGDNTPDKASDSEIEDGEIRDDVIAESIESPPMSRVDAERKIAEDVKELFSYRNLDEAKEYFRDLPSNYHSLLVEKATVRVLDGKEADAKFVASFFEQSIVHQLCTLADLEEGLSTQVEFLDDISVDVPAAYQLMAIVCKGAQFPRETVERLAEKIAVDSDPVVPPKQKLLSEYDKLS